MRNTAPIRSDHPSPISCGPNLLDIQETAKYTPRHKKEVLINQVQQFLEKYASKSEVQGKIIYPALRPVAECHQAGITTGILSAGYEDGIRMILKAAGYYDSFDFLLANPLETDGRRVTGFKLNILRNKAEVLRKLLEERQLEADRVVYLGDKVDDAGCFEIAGYPVVSFLAPDSLKEQFARQYGAFVPQDEGDLADYLKCV